MANLMADLMANLMAKLMTNLMASHGLGAPHPCAGPRHAGGRRT